MSRYLVGNLDSLTFDGLVYTYHQEVELSPTQVRDFLSAGFVLKSVTTVEIDDDAERDIWAPPLD